MDAHSSDVIKLPLINAHDRLSNKCFAKLYFGRGEVVGVGVGLREQFRGFTGTYDLLNAMHNMRLYWKLFSWK